MILTKKTDNKEIIVCFSYSETCKNVYKHFSVEINGKRSNIKGLLKYINNNAPSILTAKTYFWNSASAANQRRSNEVKRLSEVEQYFISQGFNLL